MKENSIIEFVRQKDFRLIKKIGNGAMGQTVLLRDEYLDVDFVCKKYMPLVGIPKEEYYKNFIEEIKLLHLLYHKNIVRVFNYYLYPEQYTGYIMMEHIIGQDIEVYLESYPENFNSIFEQTIDGFLYLEENNILHRDIRPSNILVDENDNVKIIDFGFGKQVKVDEDFEKSISLNWWGDEKPNDLKSGIYNSKTEIFFIGKLFQGFLENNDISFKYRQVLKKMIQLNINDRINSFAEIRKEIKNHNTIDSLFSEEEKRIYQDFAYQIFNVINRRESESNIVKEVDKTLRGLEFLHKKTMLEDYVHPKHISNVFIEGGYEFRFIYDNDYISTQLLRDFTNLYKSLTKEKQNIVIYNLETRFEDLDVYYDIDNDEIPF
ncbi:MAG: protein kinase family protein [Candidatus Delongbacteria bacterium]|nr:protein kinase family protein [Candidatus Delongbacteria bacterium]